MRIRCERNRNIGFPGRKKSAGMRKPGCKLLRCKELGYVLFE
jgi:hypothetical protein